MADPPPVPGTYPKSIPLALKNPLSGSAKRLVISLIGLLQPATENLSNACKLEFAENAVKKNAMLTAFKLNFVLRV